MAQQLAPELQVVVPHKCILGEGPVWDHRKQTICWLDIVNGEIHEYDTRKKTFRTIPVHQMIGSFAICADGETMIAGLKNGLGFVDRRSGKVGIFADPEKDLPGNRFNDGKCDPAGRFWAGTMSHTDEPKKGSLYVANNGQVQKKIAGVSISNGMAWSPDHQTLYFVDTPTHQVDAFDYDEPTGEITNRRPAFKIPKEEGSPDGMTIDNQGMLWVCHWDGWQVSRWNPHTGEKLLFFSVPAARVTCCTFGGENLEDLYITTAKRDLTDKQLEEQPLAGSLFVWKNCGFKGMPAFTYKD